MSFAINPSKNLEHPTIPYSAATSKSILPTEEEAKTAALAIRIDRVENDLKEMKRWIIDLSPNGNVNPEYAGTYLSIIPHDIFNIINHMTDGARLELFLSNLEKLIGFKGLVSLDFTSGQLKMSSYASSTRRSIDFGSSYYLLKEYEDLKNIFNDKKIETLMLKSGLKDYWKKIFSYINPLTSWGILYWSLLNSIAFVQSKQSIEHTNYINKGLALQAFETLQILLKKPEAADDFKQIIKSYYHERIIEILTGFIDHPDKVDEMVALYRLTYTPPQPNFDYRIINGVEGVYRLLYKKE